MDLGTVLLWGHSQDVDDFRESARLAEEVGCDVIGIGDSAAGWHDLVVSLTIAGCETKSAKVMSLVTAPHLRHPSIVAGAMCSVDALTGGRAAVGISTGGSALHTIGRKKAHVDELRAYVNTVRCLCNGEPAEWDGLPLKPLKTARPIPIYISADGPKGLQLASELADGVVIQVGFDLDFVEEKLRRLRAGAEAAGRDFSELDVWGLTYGAVRDSYQEAVKDVTAFLAVNANSLQWKWAMDRVPEEYKGPLRELLTRYDTTEHVIPGGKNARLVEELGLADFLAGYYTVCGRPADIRRAADGLEQAGISCLICALPGNSDPAGTLRRFSAALVEPAGEPARSA